MKILVDIPKKTFEEIQERSIITCGETFAQKLVKYIRNGTPLPEHHGRLIDADELKKHKYHDSDRFENAVAVAQIDWADTIIEADKEE